ncbi:MAG TPA: dihydrofolate reductase family protein [Thermoplasmata archaeon]|nr:dihydrofolate reductase family protein [Thermoplasmata archaeon]
MAERPRVFLNCAVSLDGRLAYAEGRRAMLSGPEDLARVQGLRAESDAVLVGVGTVLKDNPSLRVHWELLGKKSGRTPARVVLDTHARTPEGARVLDGSVATLVATGAAARRRFPPYVETFRSGSDRVDLDALLHHLVGWGVQTLMVEGGATVLSSFLRGGLADRLTVYVAPVVIGGRSAPSMVAGPESTGPEDAVPMTRVSATPLGEGTLLEYRPSRPPKASL